MRSHLSDEGAGGEDEPRGPGLSGVLADAVAALEAAGDALAVAAGTEGLAGAEVGAALVALHAQQQRVARGIGRLTRGFEVSGAWADAGLRSARCWLAHRCRVSKGEARSGAGGP